MSRTVRESINIPNTLTITRMALALIAFSMLLDATLTAKVAAIALFAVAAITDFLDGQLARSRGAITTFGKILDPIADKVLVLGMFGVLAYLDVFPFWVVVPILAREVLITVVRLWCLRRGVAIAAAGSGKQKTTVQFVAIGIILAELLRTTHGAQLPQLEIAFGSSLNILMYMALGIAVWLTTTSGISFFRANWTTVKALVW